MAERQHLGVQDAFWLEMDKPTNLMVVDYLMWTTTPIDWARYRGVMRERFWERYSVFRSVPKKSEDGAWYWEEQPDADFEAHLEQMKLPKPGDDLALQEFIASQRTTPLDRDRPLWRAFLIDGYRGGSAVVLRAHHAIADGIRIVQLTLSLADASPDGGAIVAPQMPERRGLEPMPVQPLGRELATRAASLARALGGLPGEVISRAGSVASDPVKATTEGLGALGPPFAHRAAYSVGSSYRLARMAVRNPVAAARRTANLASSAVALPAASLMSGAGLRGEGGQRLERVLSAVAGDVDIVRKLLLGTRNDSTSWTGSAGTRKAVSWSSPLPLADVKEVARANHATINDVLVTCVAGTLRAYLQKHHASCASVNWDVPLNLKPFDAALPTQLGNAFAIVQLELPTNLSDPLAVLDVVRRRMHRIKNGHEAPVAFAIQDGLSKLSKALYRTLVDMLADRAVGVLTNVPGPQFPLYIAGEKVEGAMGWAPLSGDQAMSFTITSYDGKVYVGIACDVGLVPDHQQIVDGFADAFHRLSVLSL